MSNELESPIASLPIPITNVMATVLDQTNGELRCGSLIIDGAPADLCFRNASLIGRFFDPAAPTTPILSINIDDTILRGRAAFVALWGCHRTNPRGDTRRLIDQLRT
jgi:hypothetical protein